MDRDEARRLGREKLLGDRVSAALKRVGVERMVQAVTRRLGVDCGCERRAKALDRWDAKRGDGNRRR